MKAIHDKNDATESMTQGNVQQTDSLLLRNKECVGGEGE